MSRYLYCFLTTIFLISCQSSTKFSISGTITGATGETLYLEHTSLMSTIALDSCILDTHGYFHFSSISPQYPDFYRLRIGSQTLPLAIDSTEQIIITTTRDSLPYTVSIEGSPISLTMAQLRTTARTAPREELRKQTQKVIIDNPRSLAAYYAVFLKQKGEYIWNILDPQDRRMYQAVATSFQTWMPEYERTIVMHNQVMEVLLSERSIKNQQSIRQFINEAENTFLDIVLPDEEGEEQLLSDLRGEVIILDFSSYEMENAVEYIFELREIYNKYHNKGLDIYSVSLDRNQLLWEQAVEHLPWTTVRADQNTAVSVLLQYNVQGLPTLFLIDRKGNIQGRYFDFKALDTDIKKYL